MAKLCEILDRDNVTLKEVTEYIEGLSSHGDRINEVVTLNKKRQMKLWDISENSKPLSLDYLVPKDSEPLKAFPFEGKNSLLAFTRFQKVFYRTKDNVIGGYNNQSLAWLTGPGYFVVEMSSENPNEIAINYLKVPETKPDDLPPIKPNESGMSKLVYAGMIDYLRWVSSDVVIGRATKGGKLTNNWFVLCRLIK